MNKKTKLFYYILFLLITCFITLTVLIAHHPFPNLDLQISKIIQKNHAVLLDRLMIGISIFGELPWSILLVVLIAIIFFLKKYRRESYYILSILLSGLVILGAKHLINRPRPTLAHVRLVEINRFQSFPSGHVMSYLIFFGFMILLMKKLKGINPYTRNSITYLSAFFIITIPFSRVYLGAHWFSDTLAGLILGLIYLLPLCYLYLKRNGDKV